MLHLGENRARNKVNVLKKVKVGGQWKLCPVIVEPDGKLKDRVRVNGRTEVHSEGVYYIEWREDNQRRRQSISNRNLVLEHARLKTLELDANKAGICRSSQYDARHCCSSIATIYSDYQLQHRAPSDTDRQHHQCSRAYFPQRRILSARTHQGFG